jgi:large subunit ribosomal protein L21
MYALVEIKGKQYKAEKGATLKVDLFEEDKGAKVEFANVLLVSGEGGIKVGTPYVPGASVTAVVEDHVKGEKVIVFKYRKRKDSKRKQGHRQKYSLLKVEEIAGV